MRKLLLMMLTLIISSTAAIAGDLTFKIDEHNMGKVEYKSHKSVTFTFTNSSERAVTIVDTKSDCSCVKANYSKRPIKAGESGTITVTFSAKSEGAFFKSIDIATERGSQRLVIKGIVIK